jgi:hypothetical protein
MIARGSWTLSSATDPRWNCSGTGLVGGFVMPTEVKETIDRLTQTFGPPPADLTWEYMKD